MWNFSPYILTRPEGLHAKRVAVVAGTLIVVSQRFTGPGPILIVLSWQPPQSMCEVIIFLSSKTLQVGDMSSFAPPKTFLKQFSAAGFC
jgi:hypothetical protein